MPRYTKFDTKEYTDRLISGLSLHADREKALKMSAYMKNQFEFFGIQSPQRKQITRSFIAEAGYPEAGMLKEVIEILWQQPQRELQYAAQELASARIYSAGDEQIGLIEYMIIHKSWWDAVDYIAANNAGPWFRKHPQQVKPVTEAWMDSGNLWLQRAALLFQLKYKSETDEELLFRYIRRMAAEKNFFIRKAIGWVLREYSKTNPSSVINFVNNEKLSPLSRKEALKSINPAMSGGENEWKGRIETVPSKTWYLEMTNKPTESGIELPEGYTMEPFRVRGPYESLSARTSVGNDSGESPGSLAVSLYLETYKAVGGNYNWYDRLLMPEEELGVILNKDTTEIWLLKYEEEVAGFVEYDHSIKGETEIVYFGLTSGHTGKKAGYPFLLWAIDHAWHEPINRLWLHTCDMDHPAALPVYQKAGFSVYKIETVMQRVVRG